ncbi:hypothetical protein [Haladaptatus litoreus]|nr:hypothetical protein [Haladaptatus litoreus]
MTGTRRSRSKSYPRQSFAEERRVSTAMFKAQLSDGEQIRCADYEMEEVGVRLFDEDGDLLAFVPFTHLLWVGRVDDAGRTLW